MCTCRIMVGLTRTVESSGRKTEVQRSSSVEHKRQDFELLAPQIKRCETSNRIAIDTLCIYWHFCIYWHLICLCSIYSMFVVCACHICMYFIFDQQPHPLRQVFCRFEEGVGIKPIWPVTGDQYQFDSASDLGPDAFRTTSLRSRALALQLSGVPKSGVWP